MEPITTERPWGNFRQFTLNEATTVKIITVRAGEEFSLQFHNDRDEFWRILTGEAQVVIGDKTFSAQAGDEFNIPRKTNHRMRAVGQDAQFLEIAHGDFKENDITRLEDKYGRV